jgi:hypothetical protein
LATVDAWHAQIDAWSQAGREFVGWPCEISVPWDQGVVRHTTDSTVVNDGAGEQILDSFGHTRRIVGVNGSMEDVRMHSYGGETSAER